jgi:hypothetical protein
VRAILAAALLLLAVGCSAYCRDGTGRTMGNPGYKPCSDPCNKKGKPCGCSTRCPCWKNH